MVSTTSTLASALVGAATVAAHGYVENIVINGLSYSGYKVTEFPYNQNPPPVIGWATSATDKGFVSPDAYSTPDIVCHLDGENAPMHAEVAAGDSIYLQWDTWPEGHKGPVLDYLASCGDVGCESVDKTTLEFFKIAEKGLIKSGSPGYFAADELLENSIGWMVKIPEDIAPGNYVLRHEIIALHSAQDTNGAQNYPQCFNLAITGSGSAKPKGTLATELYKADDAGIALSIYDAELSQYEIPGPKLIDGVSEIEQTTSAIKESATGTMGSGKPAPTPSGNGGGNDGGNNGGSGSNEDGGEGEGEGSAAPSPTSPPFNNYPELPDNGNGNGDAPSPTFSTIAQTPSPASSPASSPEAPSPTQETPASGSGKPGKPGKDTCKHKKRSKKAARRAEGRL